MCNDCLFNFDQCRFHTWTTEPFPNCMVDLAQAALINIHQTTYHIWKTFEGSLWLEYKHSWENVCGTSFLDEKT